MAAITSELNNNVLTIRFSGRIDSGNAPLAEAEVNKAVSSNPHTSVIADLDELEYISSAGLRVILRLRKNEPTLKIVNVTSEVYEIFDMTGFTEMLPIEKGYRKLSVDGCEVIGQGANGKVYRLDPDTIIKVYFNSDALDDIHRERELARKAFVLGIPTAIPYDVVKVGDTYGSVFELLNAKSFAKLIAQQPEKLDEYVEMSVDLMRKIHSTEVKPNDMPDMKETGVKWASFTAEYLPEETGKKLVRLIKEIPTDYHMIHGDYHIKNVMLQNGETLLIDMDTLCYGHPIFELASVYNAYVGFSSVDKGVSMRFLGIPHETALSIRDKTLELYFSGRSKEEIAEIEKMAKVIGFTRLLRRNVRRKEYETEVGGKELELFKSNLISLLAEVDKLYY
ncbi:MAG: anti-sigma factor antagonist [Firmicutes bacterium]|nr:anti-sigma factor antagonist [Candidatus Colimorpha enterica]